MPNPQPTQEEILNQYTSLPDELDAQVADSSEANLDLARAEDKWTIRGIIHHFVDTDNMVKFIIIPNIILQKFWKHVRNIDCDSVELFEQKTKSLVLNCRS